MFQYDPDYTEDNWRHEANARELAELDADRRDMQEYPAPARRQDPAPCCAIPESFTYHAAPLSSDPETGYAAEPYFSCTCGVQISEEDYSTLCEWSERRLILIERFAAGQEAPERRKEAA